MRCGGPKLRVLRYLSLGVALAFLAACSSEESGPYFEIGGGGFIFNYRIAEATAGVIVVPKRTLPEDGTLKATFQNPSGGEPLVMVQEVSPTKKRYDFDTPPLTGVKAKTDYVMTVQLLDAEGKEVFKAEKVLRSDLDQTVLPDKPLTVGPGYARNPDAQQ
jgi:hypothetical protein